MTARACGGATIATMTPHALFASIVLYTKEFYDFAVTKLNPGGVLVTQSGPGSIFNITECNSVIYKTLKSVFTNVLNYACDIPSFGASWFGATFVAWAYC